MNRITQAFRGDGLLARVLRSASWMIIGYGGAQALRLASNLILTRILFPEAFGLMALVSVVTVGLSMFSDVGIGPSIAQNPRGDDPEFLDTAWTIQIIRGVGLFLGTCVLALPVASFYGDPELAWYLPIAGTAMIVSGLAPMKIETAHRHLLVGRLTVLELLSQLFGIGMMVILALATRSVMALVLGSVLQASARLLLTHYFLPGPTNRLRWDSSAARELTSFGKWIFLSTALWFVTMQGDRAILGKYLTLEMLGLYNIGYFLASFPSLLGNTVNYRLMIPVYRERPTGEAPDYLRKQRLLRTGMTAGLIAMSLVMAFAGPWLVEFLYDDRYLAAGPIVTLIACALVPAAIGLTYDQAALAAGDSQSFFVYSAVRATSQVTLILTGVIWFGLFGAITAMAVTTVISYPVLVWLARRHKVWDPLHDLSFAVLGGGFCIAALRLNWDQIAGLMTVMH